MNYGYKKQLNYSFTKAVQNTIEALKKEGFGVLTEIDVKATLKKKLNVDYDNYLILGVCNPSLAYRALQAEKDIGLLLPCNAVVYEDANKVYVAIIKPMVAMITVKNKKVEEVAKEADSKLKKVIDSL